MFALVCGFAFEARATAIHNWRQAEPASLAADHSAVALQGNSYDVAGDTSVWTGNLDGNVGWLIDDLRATGSDIEAGQFGQLVDTLQFNGARKLDQPPSLYAALLLSHVHSNELAAASASFQSSHEFVELGGRTFRVVEIDGRTRFEQLDAATARQLRPLDAVSPFIALVNRRSVAEAARSSSEPPAELAQIAITLVHDQPFIAPTDEPVPVGTLSGVTLFGLTVAGFGLVLKRRKTPHAQFRDNVLAPIIHMNNSKDSFLPDCNSVKEQGYCTFLSGPWLRLGNRLSSKTTSVLMKSIASSRSSLGTQ